MSENNQGGTPPAAPVVTPPNESVSPAKLGIAIAALGLGLGVGWYFLRSDRPSTQPRRPEPEQVGGMIRSAFNPPPGALAGATRPDLTGNTSTRPALEGPPQRARPSPMAAYTARQRPANADPAASSGTPAAPATQQLAGLNVIRAEAIPDARFFLMPGDKIKCKNNEPINGNGNANFSALIDEDVFGRDPGPHDAPLIPRGSRAVGKTLQGMDHGQTVMAAILTHIEGPTINGRPTLFVRLGDGQAGDELGTPGLQGNIDTHFWPRLGAVAAYAGLDALARVGSGIASGSINDALSGRDGSNTNVNIGSFGGMGTGRGLAGQAFDLELQRKPSFIRPQSQACTIFINQPIDFRLILQNRR